jgi:3-phenylpropionate/trans-cinnamate dioxygenase ferredoxin reductase component
MEDFMTDYSFMYAIVGGGLTGASAAAGIREVDKNGTIVVLGDEYHLAYDRPSLTKKLWFGKKKVDEIFLYDKDFYDRNGIAVKLGSRVTEIDIGRKTLRDDKTGTYHFQKLLLATGGAPRMLSIPGGDLPGIYYFRYLDDYLKLRSEAAEGKKALVIGGGFIGSEIAAALTTNKVDVSMIFSDSYLCSKVFPSDLGLSIQRRFIDKGVKILTREKPVSIVKRGNSFVASTDTGKLIESDILIVGIGINPSIELGTMAKVDTGNGIIVNEYLQTSNPEIFAAGDTVLFPYQALGKMMRVEHWDNAINQGKQAGRNMAGAHEQYTYMPYFFSDLFEFGYEAVGNVNSGLETFADWQKENDTGVIYFLNEGKVQGAMMCNVWNKVDAAREMIRREEKITAESLRGAIGNSK